MRLNDESMTDNDVLADRAHQNTDRTPPLRPLRKFKDYTGMMQAILQ